jgi:GxxExxY protein
MGLSVRTQLGIPVKYNDIQLELGFRLDILVENLVIIEIKSVDVLHDIRKKQLLTYSKLTGIKIGILVNFNDTLLGDKRSLIRIIN